MTVHSIQNMDDPRFDAATMQKLRRYFELNAILHDKYGKKINAGLPSHPLWGPLFKNYPTELKSPVSDEMLAFQRAAIFENKWEAFAIEWIDQARIFYQHRIVFADWYDLVTLYRNTVLPFVFSEFGKSEDAPVFTEGLLKITDYIVRVVAENYNKEHIDTIERKVIDREQELVSVSRELEAFSYSVSHDLRAPLRAINGYAGILEEDYAEKLDEDGMQVLKSIKVSSRNMGVLIDDLLGFSRLGRKLVSFTDLNMNAIVRSVCSELIGEDAAGKTQLEIAELQPAEGDQTLIRMVWFNLLSNAVKYSRTREVPQISIRSGESAGQIVYTITDNGVGFDMEYYDMLFGVFQRLHSEEEFEGTGIGLAIVQKIIHRHRGKVWAKSTPGNGASFHFTLPKIKLQEI